MARIDLSAAAPPAPLGRTQHKHPVAEIAKLLGDHLDLLPDLANGGGESFEAFASPVAAALIGPCHSPPPLEVRGHELGEQVIGVAAVEGINARLATSTCLGACVSEYPEAPLATQRWRPQAPYPQLREFDEETGQRPGLAGPPDAAAGYLVDGVRQPRPRALDLRGLGTW